VESYPIGGWFLFGIYGALNLFNVLGLSYLNEVNLQKVAQGINHDKFVNEDSKIILYSYQME